MEKFIFKSAAAENKDKDVAEFGGFSPQELRKPEARPQLPDFFAIEAHHSLRTNALNRALYFAYGIGDKPPVHFPNAEHFQHIPFTYEHWSSYGNMEAERSRITFMLEKYQSRQFPEVFDPITRDVLKNEDVLASWGNQFRRIDETCRELYEDIQTQMKKLKELDPHHEDGEEGAYQTLPIFYKVSEEGGKSERALWERGLTQITKELQEGNFRNIYNFLHLYRHVKDPVTPIRSNYPKQVEIFKQLYEESKALAEGKDLSIEGEKFLVSQLALESSFLALPGAADVAMVVYHDAHELPYIYVDLAQFPRGEFAGPERVVTIFHELLSDSEKRGRIVATPITVSYFQGPHQTQPELFIIDGNNRATAIFLMKFINFVDFQGEQIVNYQDSLRRFMALYDLDIEWERDLSQAIKWLLSDEAKAKGYDVGSLLTNREMIKEFATGLVPALLVQEPNFHTVAVALSKEKEIVLLQPMHQTIYNQKRGCIAIPSKQQSHGRTEGNDLQITLRSEILS